MTCFHPLKGFILGVKPNGKNDLKICSINIDTVVQDVNGIFHYFTSERPYTVFNRRVGDKVYRDYLMIRCGQCIGCRIDKSREWANRCLLEMKYHPSTMFITLTYDDLHLPKSVYADEDGVKQETGNLIKSDWQGFMKRLRDHYSRKSDHKLRFFACGEYGSETFRPHFHGIIFGLELDDLVFYKKSPDGKFNYYNSEFLQSCWRDGKGLNIGYAVVAPASWNTCSYVARYVTKKLGAVEKDFYEKHNINPEFTLMSNKPGLARWYYDENKDILYDYKYINVPTDDGGKKFTPPSYFNRLYDIDYPAESAALKEQRRSMAAALMDARLKDTDLSLEEYLKVEESAFKNKTSSLKRSGV